MKLIFCFIFCTSYTAFLVNCVIHVIEYYVKSVQGRYFYVYGDIHYPNEEDLIYDLGNLYPELINKEVYLKGVGEIGSNGRTYYFPDNSVLTRICLPAPFIKTKKLKKVQVEGIDENEVIKHTGPKKVTFVCNKNTVPTLTHLAKCAYYGRSKAVGRNCEARFSEHDPPNSIVKVPFVFPKPRRCPASEDIFLIALYSKVKKNTYSNIVWKSIWKTSINLACLTHRRHSLLKERFLRELNSYRTDHRVFPLVEDPNLSEMAQDYASNLSQIQRKYSESGRNLELIFGSSELFSAPLFIKHWYDEKRYYNFLLGRANYRCQNFIKLVWKSFKLIGMGIAKNVNCFTHVFEYYVTLIRRRYFYVYGEVNYSNEEDLIYDLGKQHPELINKEIFLKGVGEIVSKNKTLYFPYNSVISRICLPAPYIRSVKLKKVKVKDINDNEIIKHTGPKKVTFVCNKNTVPSLIQLAKCVLYGSSTTVGINCERKFSKHDPPNCIEKVPFVFPKPKRCAASEDLVLTALYSKLRKKSYSDCVWRSIWITSINFACFSERKHSLLKERYLRELNHYRTDHGVLPLVENPSLSEIAQEYASDLNKIRNKYSEKGNKFEVVVGSADYFTAPLLIKKWYEESYYYNYLLGRINRKCQNFARIIWKGTRQIGIGIAKNSCKVNVVLLLYPKRKFLSLNYLNIRQRKVSNSKGVNCVTHVFEYYVRFMRGKYFMVFGGTTYPNEKDLIYDLIRQYPELKNQEVYLRGLGEITSTYMLYKVYEPAYAKVCLSDPYDKENKKSKVKGISDNEVIKHSSLKKVTFVCNKTTVPSLTHLAKCALYGQPSEVGANCERYFSKHDPPNCVEKVSFKLPNSKRCSNSEDVVLEALYSKLGTNKFTDSVWKAIWLSSINFACFSYKKYLLLKQRYLRELNSYRTAHEAPSLVESSELSKIAQSYAANLNQIKQKYRDDGKEFELIVDSTDFLTAPLLIKKWYEESSYYDYRFGRINSKCQNFAKLIWKNTAIIGIGVAKNSCKLNVVLLLYPKRRFASSNLWNIKKRRVSNLKRSRSLSE
uniref:SCP domain-containing protein n=1 Tax=Strongyloides stercoralis TaxID=6248 RepID=A0AAF5HXA9_STRER